MKEVVSVKVMRESDEYTIKIKTDSLTLMKRAGEAIYNAIQWQGRIAIVCGTGNNAGDGYVLAELLGDCCHLFLVKEKFSEDGRYYFEKAREAGVGYSVICEETSFEEFDMIVDCIFGTGFKGEVTGMVKDVIDKINESGKYVVSCDIPSGLNGDTGKGYSVVSDVTVSVGTLKPGLLLNEAKDKIRKLINCRIGIDIIGEKYYLMEKEDFLGLIPERKNYSHKGNYGYTAIWGGSEEYSGAVKLSNLSLSALKSGCGVNRLIVSEMIADFVAPYLLESTLCKVPERFDKESTDKALMGITSLGIGMGWGQSEENEKTLRYILENGEIRLVIDADGLNTLAKMGCETLLETKCKVCLTPHPKEFERLSGVKIKDVTISVAKEFAKKYNVVLLLKGTATIITDGEEVYIVNKGCAGMATAGSGDVLSGILAGLLGYMECDIKTVALGAYIAGSAGEKAQEKINAVSMTASDSVNEIKNVISELL